MSISLQLKNKPIILKYSKQGMPGRTGAQGLPGEDATSWEVALSMEGIPSGTCTVRLYKDGEICSQEIHYAEIFVMPLNRYEFIRSNTLSRTISGTYIFQYTNVRSILVIIWEDSGQEKVLCADSVANFRGRDLRVLQLPVQQFTTAQWQTYGAAGYTRTWTTGAAYDNSTLENGDLVLIPGTVTDQRDQQDNQVSGFILGTVVIPDGGSAERSVQVISRAFFIGPAGAAATIKVGTVTTLPAGSKATVVNKGTDNNAVFDFGIPEGEPGPDSGSGKFLPLTGGTLSGHLIFGGNSKCVRFIPDDTTTLQYVQTTLRNNGRLCVWYRNAGAGSELFEFPAVDASATGNNYYDVLTSKTPVTIAQGGTGAKTAIGALANLGAVNKAGDTVTGPIIYKNSEMDIAANSLPNAVYASTYIIRDKNNQNVAFLETSQADTGEVALDINAGRKNASGTRVENNIRLSVAKDGTRNVQVSDAAAWRSAIGAVNKAGDTMTGALIVKRDGASLEAYNANGKRGFGIYMNADGTSYIRSYNVSTGYAINFNLPTPLDTRAANQGQYIPAMQCGTAALTSGASVMDNNTIYLQYE